MYTPKPYQAHLNSFINLKKVSHLLFAACCRAKKENKVETNVIPEEKPEVNINEAYFYFSSKNSDLPDIKSLSSSSKDDKNDQDN